MTLSINGKTYEAGELIAYVSKLEKENAQWKQRNETLKDALEHARKLYGDELEKAYKENAELKDRNQELLESCEGATMMYKDLCRAKEIIKKYLAIGVGGKITQNYLDVTKEAEQFLKKVK